MSLLQLPAEILFQIFEDVGSHYFRSDVARLTVCKQWNAFARIACFHDLQITTKTLRRLLASPSAASSLALARESTVAMDLELKGIEDWDAVHRATWDGPHGYEIRSGWTTELNNDMLRLAQAIKNSRNLRSLRIIATAEMHSSIIFSPRCAYLYTFTIRPFLSTHSLATLELDFAGTKLTQSEDEGQDFHVCTGIAALLSTLVCLRLRMRNICTNALKPEQHAKNLRLNEVLVNLSLTDEAPPITSATHATCCNIPSPGFIQLKHDMQEQARVLVTQMAAPKIVRVLNHRLSNLEIEVFDILTGETIVLQEEAEWVSDNEEIVWDQTAEVESEISSLSSDEET